MVGVDDTVSFTSENFEKSNLAMLNRVQLNHPSEEPNTLPKLDEESSGAQGRE